MPTTTVICRGCATNLVLGSETTGVLDNSDDFDYFRFEAEEGQRYEISLKYSGESDRRPIVYESDGLTPVGYYVASGTRQSGKYIVWDATTSGTHYVLVFSPKGEEGEYALMVAAETTDQTGG